MIGSRIKPLVPTPLRRPLRLVWHTFQTGFYYARGKKILWDYSSHHRRASRKFDDGMGRNGMVVGSVRDVGVRVITFGNADNIIDLPKQYLQLVDQIAKDVRPRFSRSADCSFFPDLPDGPVPDRSEDILAVKNGEVIMIRLTNPFEVKGLEDLCAPIVREIERKIYGAHVLVEKVYLYRNPVSRQTRRVSWLWHFDNHPYEVLKVMIYLTHVDRQNAPFEYLVKSGKAVPGSPIAPLYGHSRISDQKIARYFARGFESCEVTGPKGTMILFDNDVIHRGNLALQTHRDVLIFQIRPIAEGLTPYIDERWTGSFQHADFSPDPEVVVPSFRKLKGFSR